MPETANLTLADSLDAAAKALEAEAKRLRRRAETARQTAQTTHAITLKVARARNAAQSALRRGQSLGHVTAAILEAAPLKRTHAIQISQQEARAHERTSRQRRNEAIMRHKVTGLSNAQIAERLGLHEKSVARIVGKMRRAAPCT